VRGLGLGLGLELELELVSSLIAGRRSPVAGR
jgi:hypothetical protein